MNEVARGRARRVGAPLLLLLGMPLVAAAWSCSDDPVVDGADGSPDGNGDAKDTGADAPPVTCPSGKEPKDDPTCVTNDLGIFVSAAGNDGDPGTKEKPVATLGAALTKAGTGGKGKIFVCEGSYTESVTISSTIGVYGGFKCADWSYSGTKPKIAGAKPDFVVKIDGASGVTIADLELDGKDGAPNSGESSVSLFVSQSTSAKLERDLLVAGNGSKGADGVTSPVSFPAGSVLKGNDGSGNAGGVANTFNCPVGGTTVGGKGGDIALAGATGSPSLGAGDGGAAGPSSGQPCSAGSKGANASKAADGDGSKIVGSVGLGWSPENGKDGAPGSPGQGGGGGGGQLDGVNSGGGGGGGAGGCGGAGGGGGKGGGASIAMLVVASDVAVGNSELTSKNGGSGGSGATGQAGQGAGGAKGNGVLNACPGGGGGSGGDGGAGGGGAGGVSVGILYKGTKPVTDTATDGKISVGTKGNKGLGGATPANDGIDGVAQAVLQVP